MSEKELIESLETQLQELRKDLQKLREAKKKQDEGHWITVHSDSGHGTHIFIKGDGTVGKGPADLVGKSVKTAVKKASTKPAAKAPSSSLGLGGTMAGTSSLPSSGGNVIDISKYQTSIPLTPAASKAAAKPAPSPKASKVEPSKPAGPQNIDIGGYKFEMPKVKPAEAPKPVEAPKAVEPPKPLETPQTGISGPTKGDHEHWNDVAKSKYLGTVAKGTHIPGKLSTLTSGDITDSNGKTTGDVHVFDSAVAALSAKGADMKKDPNNTNLYAYPTKGIKVHDDEASAEKAHSKALANNLSFIKLKNVIDGKHENNEQTPHKTYNLAAEAISMTPIGNYMHTVEPKEFSTPAEAAAAFKNESKATYDKLIAGGASKDLADQITKQIHPPKNYTVMKKNLPPTEAPDHSSSGYESSIPKHNRPTPTSVSSQNEIPALDILANPTGVKGGMFVKHGETKSFPSHEDARWAYQHDLETTIRELKKANYSGSIKDKANELVRPSSYEVDPSMVPQVSSAPPIHSEWEFKSNDSRPEKVASTKVKPLSTSDFAPSVVVSTKDYSNSAYSGLNKSLRMDEDLNQYQKKDKENLDLFIAKHGATKKPFTVWRGIKDFVPEKDNDIRKVDHKEMLKRFQQNIGNVITLAGFQSTSSRPSKALQFSGALHDSGKFIFEIRGSHGGNMNKSFSYIPKENEILLGHNWKYRVIGIEKVPFDCLEGSSLGKYRTVVKLEHIP